MQLYTKAKRHDLSSWYDQPPIFWEPARECWGKEVRRESYNITDYSRKHCCNGLLFVSDGAKEQQKFGEITLYTKCYKVQILLLKSSIRLASKNSIQYKIKEKCMMSASAYMYSSCVHKTRVPKVCIQAFRPVQCAAAFINEDSQRQSSNGPGRHHETSLLLKGP